MVALDLLGQDRGGRLELGGRAPKGRNRVIIVGAGMAGMSCAWELGRLGYECTVLEARARPGGRCWTVRGGTSETELGGRPQSCHFDDGLFMNAGPMRISHHHETTLAYCREFGVPLTTFTNVNEAAYVLRSGQPKVRLGRLRAEMRGYTAELLAKVIRQDKLDAPLTAEDRERLIQYLRVEGNLNPDLSHRPAAAASDKPSVALDLEAILKAGLPQAFSLGLDFNQQATMLTPVGGMDRLAHAFADKLGSAVRYGAVVTEIRRSAAGSIRIQYSGGAPGGPPREVTGDFCVCALPPVVLARIPADFSEPVAGAIRTPRAGTAGKIGLQFKRRFWEEDDDIYGGISVTDLPITQIVYPSQGFGNRNGVLIGYYHFGNSKRELNDQPVPEREHRALAQGGEIHPQYPAEFENSFSVAWEKIPYSEMSWVRWPGGDAFERGARVLGAGDGPFYFAGDWVTRLNGWQAGAFISAHAVCRALHRRARQG